jgi:hypothetical protein
MVNNGEIYSSNCYGDFEIIDNSDWKRVKVRFIETGYEVYAQTGHIVRGVVKDKMKPSIYGVGFIGDGIHRSKINGVRTPSYRKWNRMIKRCYDPKWHARHRYAGRGVTVCDEWLNFQNFADWFDRQENTDLELDKHLTVTKSRIYSPETCSFVPHVINSLTNDHPSRDRKIPVGVYKAGNKFAAQCSDENGDQKTIGVFNSPNEAFLAYKGRKRQVMIFLSRKYYKKGLISKTIRDNLMNWDIVPYPD